MNSHRINQLCPEIATQISMQNGGFELINRTNEGESFCEVLAPEVLFCETKGKGRKEMKLKGSNIKDARFINRTIIGII